MAKKKLICGLTALLLAGCGLTGLMGCGKQETAAGKTEIEIVSYKKEAVDTFNEIAEKLNVPLGTVKSRIFFARQELQKVLKDFRLS